jgi:hypothetical protein
MSTYASQQQTRQQLDELDALLQRMLSLPLSSADPATLKAPSTSAEAFAPLPPTLPAMPAAPPRSSSHAGVQAWRVETVPPVAQLMGSAPGQDELPLADPVDSPAVPPYAPPPPQPRFSVPQIPSANPQGQAASPSVPYPFMAVYGQSGQVPASAQEAAIPAPQWQSPKAVVEPGTPFILWPLVPVNWVFDLFTHLLGPLGFWLRRPSGRTALGWLGILMIVGAVGWAVADWYGMDWTR